MEKNIEMEFTDDQLANFPSYSWPLKCCWCGSGMGAQVRAREVNGIKFRCQMCGKTNYVNRRGNKVSITSRSGFPVGCLVMIAAIIGFLALFVPIKWPSFHLPSFSLPKEPELFARILSWVGYFAALATLFNLPIQIKRWRTVKRLYGGIPYSLAWQIGLYSSKNRMLRIQLWIVFIMLSYLIPGIIIWLGSNIFDFFPVFDNRARSHLVSVFLISLWQIMRTVKFLLPPTALLLGTAKSVNIHLIAVLNQKLRSYRIVSLLDLKKEHIFPLFASDVMFNNLRTVNGYEWRTVVHHLMDVVPVIIVDHAVSTEYVDAELNRIEKFGYGYKVVSYSSAAYGWEINAIEAGTGKVVSAAKQLGEEVMTKIQAHLSRPIDITPRLESQKYYNAMIKKVPWQVRFTSDINAMLIKAHFILAWTMENYLHTCKKPVSGDYSDWLLEDLPSIISPEEEETYLRQSRGLDEVMGIASSALDMALQTPGPQQAFNIANAHCKIGKCSRFSKEWDVAIDHLTTSIEMLSKMSTGVIMPPINLRQIKTELADAHFLRGEVYMARFRKTASVDDRDNAESDFRASMDLDAELGQSSSNTLCRIKSLHNIL